jgi:uncharacterized protein YerC
MGKFTNTKKLSKQEQDELFIRFAQVLSMLHGSVEAANFIRDLLSEQEALMLARRIWIAELLQQGCTYEQICREIKVGPGTIAKVQHWMETYGDGFRTVIKRVSGKSKQKVELSVWRQHKKKYPMYYWPQLLLEEMVKSANKRERERLLRIVNGLRDKTMLSRDLLKLLQNFHT